MKRTSHLSNLFDELSKEDQRLPMTGIFVLEERQDPCARPQIETNPEVVEFFLEALVKQGNEKVSGRSGGE